MPFIFKIGFFLALSFLCLSCPLRTLIRQKTKLVPLKVRKVYFAEAEKRSPFLTNSLNGPGLTDGSATIYSSQVAHASNLPSLPHTLQKVTLDATTSSPHDLSIPEQNNLNTTHIQPYQNLNLESHAAISFKVDMKENKGLNQLKHEHQNLVMLSPSYNNCKPMLLSPIFENKQDKTEQSGFLLLPIDSIRNATTPILMESREHLHTDINTQTFTSRKPLSNHIFKNTKLRFFLDIGTRFFPIVKARLQDFVFFVPPPPPKKGTIFSLFFSR